MKVVKETGLVPVVALSTFDRYQKDQAFGLDPAKVRKMLREEKPRIRLAKGNELKGVDMTGADDGEDETFEDVVVETPAIGGKDKAPPLAANNLPGRNRASESGVLRQDGADITEPREGTEGSAPPAPPA